jgi:signal transduction histidine kinase
MPKPAKEKSSDQDRRKERESFLLHASTILGSSLDYQSTLQNVARLAVPRLADWCGVQILDEDGELQSVAVAHVDPAKVEFARAFQKKYPAKMSDATGAANVIRTGKTEYVFDVTEDMLLNAGLGPERLADIRKLNIRAAITAPLTVGGRTLGVLSLVTAESGPRLTMDDVSLAEELGRRAAVAIDNAQRFSAEQSARRAAERNADRIARLQRVTAALAKAPTARAIADAVIMQGLSAFDADEAVLTVLKPDKKTLEIIRSIGLREGVEEEYHFFAVDAPLPISEAVRTGEPVFLSNRQEMIEHYPQLEEAEHVEALAWAAMPLVVEDSVVGGIALGFKKDHEFSPEDREFAMALARQSAQALERARLHDAETALRAEAEDARRRAEDANRAKSQFLATMSHELRTPLNAIAGYIQLLELGIHGPVPEKQLEVLARVQRSQRTLLSLIDDILSFARIESGKIEYRFAQVSVMEVLRAAYDLVAPQLSQRGLVFNQKIKDPSLTVWTDREKFIQILVNLFSNAVKFTDHGTITVDCEKTGSSVQVSVADTGRGIPTDKLELIFEPFVQADSGLTRRTEGSGLGLAISRDLARAMRGDLTVKSVEGKGSTFTLWLPTAAPE